MSVSGDEGQQDWSVDPDTVSKVHDILMQYGDPVARDQKLNVTDSPPICPTYFNRTESLRYVNILAPVDFLIGVTFMYFF